MRKYIFNGAVLSAVFSAWSVVSATKNGPHDWRLALAWASWGISVAIAVGSVMEEAEEREALKLED